MGDSGEKGISYLMGLNMAFPKSENLSASFRWTPLGFTTGEAKGALMIFLSFCMCSGFLFFSRI